MEFLSGLNFVIFYTSDQENRKTDSFTCWPNDCPADNYDDQQQHLLQTILSSEKLEISSIDLNESEITPEKIIQANLANPYCIKLCKTILTHSFIEGINTCHLLVLSIDTRGCICRFNRF